MKFSINGRIFLSSVVKELRSAWSLVLVRMSSMELSMSEEELVMGGADGAWSWLVVPIRTC